MRIKISNINKNKANHNQHQAVAQLLPMTSCHNVLIYDADDSRIAEIHTFYSSFRLFMPFSPVLSRSPSFEEPKIGANSERSS